jgi:hypothetical protein
MKTRRFEVAVITLLALGIGSSAVAQAQDAQPAAVQAAALPEPAPKKLSFIIGAGSINSPGAAGGALWTGLRLSLGPHFAGSVDLGYGLAGTAPSDQDRWWVIPTLAAVIPTAPMRIELGLGAGVGTSSGYRAWSEYFSTPFLPEWHDTVPIVRAHASAARSLTPNVDIFARAEVASLLFASEHDGTIDTLWLALWVGLQVGIL